MSDPLIRPVAEWPLILCGPMLRRVTPKSVTVFVALKEARQVRLNLYTAPTSPRPTSAFATVAVDTIALGERLHVAAVTLALDTADRLQLGHLYGYDVVFSTATGLSQSLDDLGLLSGELPLGYDAGLLPGFALPTNMSKAHLVYGSCRKPHGEGADRLADVDEVLEDSHSDADTRPHYLFLTGDQIYADDVCLSVASVIAALQPELLGWPHPEVVVSADEPAGYTADHPDMRPGIPRGTTMLRNAKLTTKEADGHLLFLGEYYAMYLLTWSGVLWPRVEGKPIAPDVSSTVGSDIALQRTWENKFIVMFDEATVRKERLGNSAHITTVADAQEQREHAQAYVEKIPHVRRLLANVPSLMIFDDHEVTDDWNLRGDWVQRVRGTEMGRRIIRNALTAYSIFQDWGNRPEYYEPHAAGRELIEAAQFSPEIPGSPQTPLMLPTPPILAKSPPMGPATFDLTGANLPPFAGTGSQPLDWYWSVDLEPLPLRIRAVDSRTVREFPALGYDPPALLAGADLEAQLAIPPSSDPQRVEIVLTAAPILGILLWEEFAQRMLLPYKGAAYVDYEPWSGHRASFEAVLARLARFGSVIVLSGDVHSGHTCDAAWFGTGAGGADVRGRIVQLCSSGFKNEDLQHRVLGMAGHEPNPSDHEMQLEWLGWNTLPPLSTTPDTTQELKDRVSSDGWSSLLDAPVAFLRSKPKETWTDFAGLAWRSWLLRSLNVRLESPVVLPVDYWPGDSSQQLIDDLAAQSEWAYRVTYANDSRDERNIFMEHDTREIIGVNNFGRVRFTVDGFGNPTHVVHRIYDRDLAALAGGYVEHSVALAPPASAERPGQ